MKQSLALAAILSSGIISGLMATDPLVLSCLTHNNNFYVINRNNYPLFISIKNSSTTPEGLIEIKAGKSLCLALDSSQDTVINIHKNPEGPKDKGVMGFVNKTKQLGSYTFSAGKRIYIQAHDYHTSKKGRGPAILSPLEGRKKAGKRYLEDGVTAYPDNNVTDKDITFDEPKGLLAD